jgi:ABC-2 type transport system permease protein
VSAGAVRPGGGPRQIKGPSAIGSDWRRFASLTWTLAVTDFKLRFFGSALGYLWTLMRPLMLFGVLLLLFTQVLDLADDVVLYPQALLLALVLFNFFSEGTATSIRAIVDREHIVRKVDFPRLAVPLAIVLQALFNLALSLVVFFIFLFAAGGEPRWSWLQLIPLIGLLTIFTTGLAMLLSMLFVRARDVQPIWDVVLQAMFYLTPIFYTVELVARQFNAGAVEYLVTLNPLAAIVQQARHAVIDPSHPAAATAAGGTLKLLIPFAIGLVLVVAGAQLFRKRAAGVAEEL